jgi:hypothetical protein
MTVAPRFVRMLLSTSWAHCEAVYKRAGVHTISLGRSGLSEEMSEPAALSRLSLDLKDTGESAAAAMAAEIPNFSPGRNTTVSFASRA